LPFVRVPAQLHLRAQLLAPFERQLRGLVAELGVADRVFFHGLVPPSEAVRVASAHDIGLNLMPRGCVNHDLAAPNKLFTYAMAGLAIGSTATRGAAAVLKTMAGSSLQYTPGNHAELALRINELAAEPGRLHAMRTEAFQLAQTRFNWDVEQRRIVDLVAGLERPLTTAVAWRPAQT
jgi:glycosyltransferase involved in cell wall biosynthesis